MKKWIVAVIACVVVLISSPSKAFELHYSGQKEFSIGVLTLEQLYGDEWISDSHFTFDQSLQINFHGEDEDGYIRGFVTDNPELQEQVFVDMNLSAFKFQWDRYDRGFLRPSWFGLEQKFHGLRFSYSMPYDEVSFIGLGGDNFLREKELLITMGDLKEPIVDGKYDSASDKMRLDYPATTTSMQAWLNGVQLRYGADYYLDTTKNRIVLLVPIFEENRLYIKYFQTGKDYLLLGGRYDHYFMLPKLGQHLEGGALLLQTRMDNEIKQMLGTEWFYQPKPWWNVELNAGFVEKGVRLDGELPFDVNWRMAHQWNWPNLNVSLDYQEISNRFQGLLSNGREGKHLKVSGLFEGEKVIVKHGQNYHWQLDGTPVERDGDIELILVHPDWVPYFFYSVYEAEGIIRQHAIGELGYQVSLPKERGFLTYLMGVDTTASPEKVELMLNTKPYLGARYQKKPGQSLGVRVYGKEGLEFNRFVFSGDWQEGLVLWKGQLQYQPDLYQVDNNLSWAENGVNINLNWVQSRNFTDNREYLSLDLNLDFSQRTQSEAVLWANLLRDGERGFENHTYKVGFEKAFSQANVGYGEISIGEMKKYYNVGVRGYHGYLEHSLGYTRTDEQQLYPYYQEKLDPVTGQPMIDPETGEPILEVTEILHSTTTHGINLSLGAEDWISFNGEIDFNFAGIQRTTLDLEYPFSPEWKLGVNYSGQLKDVKERELKIRTVYSF